MYPQPPQVFLDISISCKRYLQLIFYVMSTVDIPGLLYFTSSLHLIIWVIPIGLYRIPFAITRKNKHTPFLSLFLSHTHSNFNMRYRQKCRFIARKTLRKISVIGCLYNSFTCVYISVECLLTAKR